MGGARSTANEGFGRSRSGLYDTELGIDDFECRLFSNRSSTDNNIIVYKITTIFIKKDIASIYFMFKYVFFIIFFCY